jgi:hypothetical protein
VANTESTGKSPARSGSVELGRCKFLEPDNLVRSESRIHELLIEREARGVTFGEAVVDDLGKVSRWIHRRSWPVSVLHSGAALEFDFWTRTFDDSLIGRGSCGSLDPDPREGKVLSHPIS